MSETDIASLASPKLERDENGRLLPGQRSLNPNGRPRGKSLKEFAREYLMNLPDDQKKDYLDKLPQDIVWKMAEGMPHQDSSHEVKGEMKVEISKEIAEKNVLDS